MKNSFLFNRFFLAQLQFALTITLKGTVIDMEGDQLHFPFVQKKQKHVTCNNSIGRVS